MKASFTFRSKVALINFDAANKLLSQLGLVGMNGLPKSHVPQVDAIAVNIQKQSCFGGWDINAKALNYFFKSVVA